METNTQAKVGKSRKLIWIGGGIVLIAIVLGIFASWLLYQRTVKTLTENLRERLQSISITQAANIDAKNIEALQEEDDWKKPEWARVVTRLKKAKDDNPNIVFMYIFRKKKSDPTTMEFVADAESINPYANTDGNPTNDIDSNKDGKVEPDGADKLNWPGQDYPEASDIPEAFEAYNGPLTVKELYTDSYGQVMTGYAPITDEHGNTVAILATDIKADDFLVVTRQTLYPFLVFIAFLTLVISVLATILIFIWNRRAETFAQLDRKKTELLGFIAHQLRSPVTAIKWEIETWMDEKISKEWKEKFASTQQVTTRLYDLIQMLIGLANVELRKAVESAPLDLNTFFKEVVREHSILAERQKVHFKTSIPAELPNVMLDGKYANMPLTNLLGNAIKYTPEGGTVEFTVQIKNKMLYCTVKDTGRGIPKEEQHKIFEKQYRASNVKNLDTGGNGFGLYIAKEAVEAQGGKIWFESEGVEGKGTTFFVELPLKIATKEDLEKHKEQSDKK